MECFQCNQEVDEDSQRRRLVVWQDGDQRLFCKKCHLESGLKHLEQRGCIWMYLNKNTLETKCGSLCFEAQIKSSEKRNAKWFRINFNGIILHGFSSQKEIVMRKAKNQELAKIKFDSQKWA